jgi:Glyoxalase-like domain
VAFAVDHAFVTCAPGAPEADALLELGFVEGSRNTHPGQGTANRRFFFENFMLEFLWVADPAEVTNERTRPARLSERCSQRAAGLNPFGIILRPTQGASTPPPFLSWSYHPTYLPPELSIQIAQGTTLQEPELFYLSFMRDTGARGEPTQHALPLGHVGALRFGVPQPAELTPASRAVEQLGLVDYFQSNDHLLEVSFEGTAGKQIDLRPGLPLVFHC